MITSMVVLLAMLFIPAYAIIYMIGGPARANAFARWVFTRVRNLIRGILQWVGRQVGDLANRNPLMAGICAILFLIFLYLIFGGHLR